MGDETSEGEWIAANAAAEIANAATGRPGFALAAMIERLKLGLIRARARTAVAVDSRTPSPAIRRDGWNIPDWFWTNYTESDFARWRWSLGDFHSQEPRTLALARAQRTVKISAFGVTMLRADVEREFPALERADPVRAQSPAPPASPAGSKPPGRPEKQRRSLEIFAERAAAGRTLQNKADEARMIVKAWGGANPPMAATVAGYLQKLHGLGSWENGKIINGADLAAAVAADLLE